jgi:archaetidylinositol phosphate synthase
MFKEFFHFKRYEALVGKTFNFLSPMTWTYIGFFLPLFGFLGVAFGKLWIGLALFLLGGIIDEIDGKVARYSNRTTYLGGFTDGVADRFTDFFFILSFFFLPFPSWVIPIPMVLFLLLFVTLMPPFIVAYADHRKAVPDPTEKVIWRLSFRVEYYFLFVFVLIFHPISVKISFGLLIASLLLNAATVVQSIILAFIKSKNYPQKS